MHRTPSAGVAAQEMVRNEGRLKVRLQNQRNLSAGLQSTTVQMEEVAEEERNENRRGWTRGKSTEVFPQSPRTRLGVKASNVLLSFPPSILTSQMINQKYPQLTKLSKVNKSASQKLFSTNKRNLQCPHKNTESPKRPQQMQRVGGKQ